MKFKKFDKIILLKLQKGDEIIKTLTDFCKENSINLATLQGLGAVSSITVGFYKLSEKEYLWKDFSKELEVTSLIGNVSMLEGEPYIHAHINLSDENFNTFGGHLKQALVGATLEVKLEVLDGEISRKKDDEIGLNLLDL